ncbi:hypothetical protein MBLNU459_g5909t1 [Dothideomycetes sp. NU459]
MPRTRNQDKTPSVEPQPVVAAARTSRKRRASSASDASVQPGSSALPQSQTKRRKKKDAAIAVDAASEEPESVEARLAELPEEPEPSSQPAPVDAPDTIAVSAQSASARHVRFTEDGEPSGDKSTATNLTPHTRKTTVHRRVTLSPATLAVDRSAAFSKKSKSRTSLPSAFSLAPDSPAVTAQEIQFTPLSQILQERVKRRLRRNRLSEESNDIHERSRDAAREVQQLRHDIEERDGRVQQLLYELEMQRQLAIDVSDENDAEHQKVRDMERELAQLRREIDERRELEATMPQLDGTYDDTDMLDNDMLIFTSQTSSNGDRVAYPQLPGDGAVPSSQSSNRTMSKTKTEETVVSSTQTQVTVPEVNIEAERQAFEAAIKYWTREASDAKAALQILTIELQSLGFGTSETSTEVVLTTIRDSFRLIRERLEAALPGEVPADISNNDLVELVILNLESLAEKTAVQEQALEASDQLKEELVREINGLIEKLSEAEIRKQSLEKGFGDLDAQGQEDEVFIAELEEKLKEIEKVNGILEGLLNEKKAQLDVLTMENKNLELNVDKLGIALEKYRVSEDTLQALISRMEIEHKQTITVLRQDNQIALDDFQAKLDVEAVKRETAELDADEKETTITNLELRIEEDESSIESLRRQVTSLEQDLAAEEEAKEIAETDRNEKTTFITELEIKIERAEANLEDLRTELGHLQDLNESERRQREAAEADLDDRNVKIGELDHKLHEQGTQANQLRQKLFEIQMREKEAIQKLESDAQEREEQFQTDMEAEIVRRQHADEETASRNVTIIQLEEALRETEENMRETLQERDDKITELAARGDQLQQELEETRIELDTALNDLELLQSSSETRIIELRADIARLQGTLADQVATIETLEAQAETTAHTHATAITERDAQIANLNHSIFTAQSRIKTLETEKASLERRVEDEAEQMLELQASKDDEIDALKTTISTKQAEIKNLGAKATEVDRVWEALMQERDEEIEELRTTSEFNAVTVSRLTKLNVALKEKFRKYVRDSTATAQAMKDDLEAALAASAQKSVDLRAEGKRVLEEVEAMDLVAEMSVEVSSERRETANSHVKRFKRATRNGGGSSSGSSSSSKRQYDSGIGVEDGDNSSMMLAE